MSFDKPWPPAYRRKGGLAVLEEVNFDSLPTRVIVLTAVEDVQDLVRAMRLGAHGIVQKQAASHLLVKSIRCIHNGEIWLNNTLTAEVMKAFGNSSDVEDKRLLSDREKEIVQLIVQGVSEQGDRGKAVHKRADGQKSSEQYLR